MRRIQSAKDFLCKVVTNIPLDLSLGVLAALVMLALLSVKVLSFELSTVEPGIVTWLSNSLLKISLLILGIGAAAVFYPRHKKLPTIVTSLTWVVFGSFVGLFYTLYSTIVGLIFSLPQAEWVAQASLWYLQLDLWLNVYRYLDPVIGFFVAHPYLYTLVDLAYGYTLYVVGLVIFVVALYSASLSRKYIMSGMVSLLIGIPLWLMLPAIAPYQLAVTTSLEQTTSQTEIIAQTAPVLDLYNKHQGTDWSDRVDQYIEYWEEVSVSYGYAVTTNPSMHIIWGVLMTVFLWRCRWWLGMIGLLFAFAESIGTMLFLQHYLIDIPFGLLFAYFTLKVTDWLYKKENDRLSVSYVFWFYPLFVLNKSSQWVAAYWKNQLDIMRK